MNQQLSTSPQNHATKDLEVIKLNVEDGLISLRGLSPKRIRFGIEYALEYGTTANSFLFTGSQDDEQQAILVHPPGANFSKNFLKELTQIIPSKITNKKLVIIMGHVNPNRVNMLRDLAQVYSNLSIICSNPGAKLLKEIWAINPQNKKDPINNSYEIKLPNIHVAEKNERISVGNKYQLQLISAPTARWPGGLIVLEETLGLLISDKFFGAHLCTSSWAEKTRISTEEQRRHYFDCLMASMSNQVNALIDQLEELDIRTIAPGHGPAIEGSWRSLLNDYRQWGEKNDNKLINVLLLFASAYGNTAAIGDALANGIRKTGIKVESLNCEFTSTSQLVNAIQSSNAYLIGSPTLGGHAPTPIVSALGSLLAEGDRSNKVGIFGSYGWSGEALDLLEKKLKDGGFEFGFDPVKIKFSPDSAMIKTIEETGTNFGRQLLQIKRRDQRRATQGMTTSKSDPAVLALGRIVGALCVLTACKGEGESTLSSAMLASWVSQASFNPPGISIAVAKDRAVESLLHIGDYFVLNVLSEKYQNEIMKQFIKPFNPGEDRLSGLEIKSSPQNQPILCKSYAWLEGCVQQRMECGDHWVIYAEAKVGQILDETSVTAVHHRRTGASY